MCKDGVCEVNDQLEALIDAYKTRVLEMLVVQPRSLEWIEQQFEDWVAASWAVLELTQEGKIQDYGRGRGFELVEVW